MGEHTSCQCRDLNEMERAEIHALSQGDLGQKIAVYHEHFERTRSCPLEASFSDTNRQAMLGVITVWLTALREEAAGRL